MEPFAHPSGPEELEERLSRPGPEDCDALRRLEGDLLILGVGGKMGPSLALRARRAIHQAGLQKRVIGVSRFTETGLAKKLEQAGVEIIPADLLDRNALPKLPDVPNVIFMAGRKFGTTGAEHQTWAMNVLLPALVAERYQHSRIVVFSSGNVYPLRRVAEGGADEKTPADPVGEYAQSVLGRERMFQYGSERYGTVAVLLRLNYAVELRYGVLAEIARNVYEQRPISLAMGHVNVIWQGDANSIALRSFSLCASPPDVLNVTGPDTLSVRSIAERFGRRFGRQPRFENAEAMEADTGLLSNAGRCHRLFGPPAVGAEDLMEWTADWIAAGGAALDNPTHFAARDGRF